jgi:hypothetical protein
LFERLQEVKLTSEDDVVVWALEKGGAYSTRSLYKFLSSGGVVSNRMVEVCGGGAKIPPKVKIFLWQVFNDILQSTE